MKNKLLPDLIIIALAATISANSMTVQAKQNDKIQNSNEQLIQDPFDTDPFFNHMMMFCSKCTKCNKLWINLSKANFHKCKIA